MTDKLLPKNEAKSVTPLPGSFAMVMCVVSLRRVPRVIQK